MSESEFKFLGERSKLIQLNELLLSIAKIIISPAGKGLTSWLSFAVSNC